MDFYSASSLKQQSAGRHIAPLGHIILISSQPVFAVTPYCCVLSGEATYTNFLVCGLTQPGLEPTIYRTRGEHVNHYATDAVWISSKLCMLGYYHMKIHILSLQQFGSEHFCRSYFPFWLVIKIIFHQKLYMWNSYITQKLFMLGHYGVCTFTYNYTSYWSDWYWRSHWLLKTIILISISLTQSLNLKLF